MNSRANPGKWDFPGGKLEAGEDIEQGLLREVKEETNLSVNLIGVAGSAQSELPERHVAYLIMEAQMVEGLLRLSDEHTEYIWVDVKEMPEMDLVEQFLPFACVYSQARSAQEPGT
jgi:8-oxo-dGTP diphosphatase